MNTQEKTFNHTHTLTKLAVYFNLGTATVNKWRAMKDYPDGAVIADGPRNLYDVVAIEAWLRSRPTPIRARPSLWREKLGLAQYAKNLSAADRRTNALKLKAG